MLRKMLPASNKNIKKMSFFYDQNLRSYDIYEFSCFPALKSFCLKR